MDKNVREIYEQGIKDALERINLEKYDSEQAARERAKSLSKTENKITSVWEKDNDGIKYYVISSEDREIAFRNGYKETVKYLEL